MAAKHFYRHAFLLLLVYFISSASSDKRFSDFKRCADQECSMLLCRGKAVKDFSGPDCRFLSFKKSETIYVYYKLSGIRDDMWAGSVGNNFGYFPKDLLAVNHHYTDKELEVPAEETDFVCFDTGFDKFDNYNIDLLIGSSGKENDCGNTGSDQTPEDNLKETISLAEHQETESENPAELDDKPVDLVKTPNDPSSSMARLDMTTEPPPTKVVESDTGATYESEEAVEDTEIEQENIAGPVLGNVVSESNNTKDTTAQSKVEGVKKREEGNEPVSISEGVKIPELKTTLGTTFDAVTTDDEMTKKVTPYEEEESNDMESPSEDDPDVREITPLLSYSKESVKTPTPDITKQQESPPVTPNDKPEAGDEKNVWTSIGDAVFTAVTGVETTSHDVSSEEDEEEDEEEAVQTDQVLQDPLESGIVQSDDTETVRDSDEHFLEDESDGDIMEHENGLDEMVQPIDETVQSNIQTESNVTSANTEVEKSDSKRTHEEPTGDREEEEVTNYPEVIRHKDEYTTVTDQETAISESRKAQEYEKIQLNHLDQHDEMMRNDVDVNLPKIVDESLSSWIHESVVKEEEKKVDSSLPNPIDDSLVEEENSVDLNLPNRIHDSLVKEEEKKVHSSLPNPIHDSLVSNEQKTLDAGLPGELHDSLAEDEEKQLDVNPPSPIHESLKTHLDSNNTTELSVEESELYDEQYTEDSYDENDTEVEEDKSEEKEELLEDENALLFTQSDSKDSDNALPETKALSSESAPETEYSDSIMRLTLLREHFTEQQMHRLQKLLGLRNLIKVEAMFSDLDTELQATRRSHTGTTQEIESALENILETSDNTILDEIEKMLDSQDSKHNIDHQMDMNSDDEETEILDDFQELAFSLRHKYSTVSDSTPVAIEKASDLDQDEHKIDVKEDVPHIAEEDKTADIPETVTKSDDNLTIADHERRPAHTVEEQMDKVHTGPDISVEEDGGHFNKNKDNQPAFSESAEMQKVPQATLENPLDLGLGVEVENSPSGSLDSMEPVSEIYEEEVGVFSSGVLLMTGFFWLCKSKIEEWNIVMISLLPEEWKPGENLFGCPWQAVVTTALVGVVTFTLFLWRTVLAVKKREYLVDERKLKEQMQALKKEKNDIMEKMSELQKKTEELKENQKQSKETVSCTMKKMEDLEGKVLEAEAKNEQMVEEKNMYIKLLKEERTSSLQNQTRIEKLEKANEKLQLNRKKIQEALAKTTVLLDEAKIREDARNVHQKSLEKDYAELKEENKTLKTTIKDWEEKHMKLGEQIKVYHKSQKELEDSLVLKDHNVEVLSQLLADLDACDLQKGDVKVLPNGEVTPEKKTIIKNRIKQMMDVSRVQTTLTVVEEERDRFMTKLVNEEKARKTLEEQHQELEHAIATLKSENSHVENQLKILQQKNEIMVEMYQQKENALQQKLTKEELERRSKENLLSEVGGKALEAEEQVKVLRQRINEMEEQMKKSEEVYKEQIKEQENKTHSNWVNARNAERALNQEKLESSKLREKLAVLSSQLNERRAPLFRPNSGQPPGPRQGDSYGPSPVSGGAPSPPLMIEGPRRPPSAPVGRRIDPYGPRPPSDPHGRFADNKHISGLDIMGPRSSSPANMDGSTQAVDPQIKVSQAEASTESPEPGPGSFLASPIRDSPGPIVQGPPPGPGPHDPLLPPGPPGRLPPPGLYRGPRPGFYHLPPGHHGPAPNVPPPLHGPPLPANGQPGMPLPGPMGGEFGPRPANGHALLSRPGPGHVIDPRGPLPPHFRPPLPPHLGPILPPSGIRGPFGPRPPIPPDMRFPGSHDHPNLPLDMAPGVPPYPANAYGQAPPSAIHNSVGAHSGPGQDLRMKQEAPQDSVKPAMVKP